MTSGSVTAREKGAVPNTVPLFVGPIISSRVARADNFLDPAAAAD